MLTLQELRQLTDKDLMDELTRASRDLLRLKMDLEGGYTKEIHNAKALKKYIARIKTIDKENTAGINLPKSKKEDLKAKPKVEAPAEKEEKTKNDQEAAK